MLQSFGRRGRWLGCSAVAIAGAVAVGRTADASSPPQVVDPGVCALVGNTPLIELQTLSRMTGRRIFAKCEHMNPGGSIKDRPVRARRERERERERGSIMIDMRVHYPALILGSFSDPD